MVVLPPKVETVETVVERRAERKPNGRSGLVPPRVPPKVETVETVVERRAERKPNGRFLPKYRWKKRRAAHNGSESLPSHRGLPRVADVLKARTILNSRDRSMQYKVYKVNAIAFEDSSQGKFGAAAGLFRFRRETGASVQRLKTFWLSSTESAAESRDRRDRRGAPQERLTVETEGHREDRRREDCR